MISKVPYEKYELQVLGDFNIDLNKPQLSWDSTIIYTNNKHKITDIKVIHTGISGHYAICCSCLTKITKQTSKGHTCIKYRCYKKYDTNAFLGDMSLLPFNQIYNINDPNAALDLLCKMLLPVIEKHVPLKSKRVEQLDIPAWLTPETIKAKKERDVLKKNKHFTEFRTQRNKVNNLVERDKKKYFDTLITDKRDTATIWKAMNEITNSSRKRTQTNKIELEPDAINEFFINIPNTILTQDIREANLNYTCPPTLINYCKEHKPLEHFYISNMTVLETGKLITDLKNSKSLGPENIPVYLLKVALPLIVEPLTYIYNLCIDKSISRTLLKEE